MTNKDPQMTIKMANAIRALAMDAVEQAKSGHPGLPLGAADIVTVLFNNFMKFDPQNPDWPDRDRFVLSAGHGSMLIYSLLYLLGYEDITIDEIKNFRQLDSKTAGHPEFDLVRGIETTTGPLGQGLATAVGMALGEYLLKSEYGKNLIDHHTYVLVSDGDLMEGISHEAAALAGHLRLAGLVVLFDDNRISIDGDLSLADSCDQQQRFAALGWHVQAVDGHDHAQIEAAIACARQNKTAPSFIACRTTIGYGAPTKSGTARSHGSPLGEDEVDKAKEYLGINYPPFTVDSDVLDAWRLVGLTAGQQYKKWLLEYEQLDHGQRGEFDRRLRGELPVEFSSAMLELINNFTRDERTIASRQASGDVLAIVNKLLPETIGGSADLTGSNNTFTADMPIVSHSTPGRYIHYGVREHAMAAAMNGLALHGGFIPYGGTFLIFSDYCRPAIRLSALMRQRVIYVLTHDSIGLGEDGPTHQPVEHLASLRAIPNLLVFRPCDAVETAECWQLALSASDSPSVLALSRQNLVPIRRETTMDNRSQFGAYIVYASGDDPMAMADVAIFATGSEVAIALEAGKLLEQEDLTVRIVSVPCFELFACQTPQYRGEIMGQSRLKVAIEAAVRQGWDNIISNDGLFIGMDTFGASAPFEQLYERFGITADNVVTQVKERLQHQSIDSV